MASECVMLRPGKYEYRGYEIVKDNNVCWTVWHDGRAVDFGRNLRECKIKVNFTELYKRDKEDVER